MWSQAGLAHSVGCDSTILFPLFCDLQLENDQ